MSILRKKSVVVAFGAMLMGVSPVYACYTFADSFESGGVNVDICPKPRLNDTGITWGGNYPTSSNSTCTGTVITAQDCSHGRDAQFLAGTLPKIGGGRAGFDFTKLGRFILPPYIFPHRCVRDNVTGLMWEVKTDDGGLHDKDNTYTWYNPDSSNNGGDAGTQNGGTCTGSDCDTSSFVTAVNSAGLCGQSDWRLPTKDELLSIADLSISNPAIDSDYFPRTQSGFYWSSSPYAYGNNDAWSVYFGFGYDSSFDKDYSHFVRLVRGL